MRRSRRHSIEELGVVRATRGDIRVEPLGERLNPKVAFPHKHDFFHLVFIKQGKGWHRIDFKTHALERNQLFIMKPGQVHGWKIQPDVQGFVLEFTPESLNRDSKHGLDLVSPLFSLPDMIRFKSSKEVEKIETLFALMSEECRERKMNYQSSLQGFLMPLLVEILRAGGVEKSATRSIENFTERFQELVENHYHEEHAVDFYGRMLGLSAKALTMRVSRSLGRSARSVIQERILLEAKRLLIYSDLSVAEVGAEVGYSDPNYFVRFFKEQVGKTPLRFREAQK